MLARDPDVDFVRIRPHGQPPSRAGGFEELASVLIEQGAVVWPAGVRFERFGAPDGGREGRGILPDGDVWAWQTKYLFTFDGSAASQVDHSVRRVLNREPRLRRFFIVLPMDLPAGDTPERTSAHSKWTAKVAQWQEAAAELGMDVDFVFIGAHELLTALTEPRHAGRARYWFSADVMSPQWQVSRVDQALAKAGRRYTPQLHVDVDTVRAVQAVAREESYAQQWQQVLADLRTARRWPWRAPKAAAAGFEEALRHCGSALDEADGALAQLVSASAATPDLPSTQTPLAAASEAVGALHRLLQAQAMSPSGHYIDEAASLYVAIRRAEDALWAGEELADSALTQAAQRRCLLLTGRAGAGKTHLLCDAARRRVAAGKPTVLLLGQDFDTRSLLGQLGQVCGLDRPLEEVLALLDAASEAAGCMGLLAIDALNESERPERWRDDLRALVAACAAHPHVALAVSCRSEFVASVVDEQDLPAVEHTGFGEDTEVAVHRFAQEYGLEPPTFPVLNPEFANPLFLKLTCEALLTLGAGRFIVATTGLVTVCRAFLEAVNRRLSEPARCDYDERSDLVARAVREIAALGGGPRAREEARQVTDRLLPERSWSRSLLRGLVAEGVLAELADGRVVFGYQRLSDVARAEALAERSQEQIREWLLELGDGLWRECGVLGALAVVVPERHGVEVVDLALDEDGRVDGDLVDGFLESLLLRSLSSVSGRTVGIVERLLPGVDPRPDAASTDAVEYADDEVLHRELWDRLVWVACVPEHPLNALWLHGHLSRMPMPARDASWSAWLIGSMDAGAANAVSRLVKWAWPMSLKDRAAVPEEVAELATVVLGWLLTTSDRAVRDRATKAIVSVAERAPEAFAAAVARFHGVDDPYVLERLAAAACGVALRSGDRDSRRLVRDAVLRLIGDTWPPHLMTRDYLRRVVDAAPVPAGLSWPGAAPPPAVWPNAIRSREEVEAMAGPPDYAYGSIWHSLTGFGDFGRYVLRSALGHVVSRDSDGLRRDVELAVFERALELGWKPERFGRLDRARSRDRHPSGGDVVERVGKKYQWIGLHEALGRISDHHGVAWMGQHEEAQPYRHPEQLIWRDIDPTVLVRKPPTPTVPLPWYSPSGATFPPPPASDYPQDMTGVPDPLDLIAVTDPDGAEWLVLESQPQWSQPLPLEVEALPVPRLAAWMQLRAYLLPVAAHSAVQRWAVGKDWYGRWMPEGAEVHSMMLGTHPDDPRWSAGAVDVDQGPALGGGPLPTRLEPCATWYGGTGTDRDASASEEVRGLVPSSRLHRALGLSRGIDFTFWDTKGVAVCDPAASRGGPATLIMKRDAVPRLTDVGLRLFWTVLIGSELHTGDHAPPGDDYRWVSASASYLLGGDDDLQRVGTLAARCAPGPVVERPLTWVTKRSDRGKAD